MTCVTTAAIGTEAEFANGAQSIGVRLEAGEVKGVYARVDPRRGRRDRRRRRSPAPPSYSSKTPSPTRRTPPVDVDRPRVAPSGSTSTCRNDGRRTISPCATTTRPGIPARPCAARYAPSGPAAEPVAGSSPIPDPRRTSAPSRRRRRAPRTGRATRPRRRRTRRPCVSRRTARRSAASSLTGTIRCASPVVATTAGSSATRSSGRQPRRRRRPRAVGHLRSERRRELPHRGRPGVEVDPYRHLAGRRHLHHVDPRASPARQHERGPERRMAGEREFSASGVKIRTS